MTSKAPTSFDYSAKSAELEELLQKLQSPNIQIDEATKLYEAGLQLVTDIEGYLKQAENTVRKHTAVS